MLFRSIVGTLPSPSDRRLGVHSHSGRVEFPLFQVVISTLYETYSYSVAHSIFRIVSHICYKQRKKGDTEQATTYSPTYKAVALTRIRFLVGHNLRLLILLLYAIKLKKKYTSSQVGNHV